MTVSATCKACGEPFVTPDAHMTPGGRLLVPETCAPCEELMAAEYPLVQLRFIVVEIGVEMALREVLSHCRDQIGSGRTAREQELADLAKDLDMLIAITAWGLVAP